MTCFGSRPLTVTVEPPDNAAPIVSGGWQIATGFAATLAPSESPRFYVVYEGGAFGHPERGIIAVIARGHAEDAESIRGARESAQLVVHSFAEGYFGARRTFGAKRAAHLALTSINAWLHGQVRNDSSRLAVLWRDGGGGADRFLPGVPQPEERNRPVIAG